ncbi:hypothetical protein [Mycolicibacterium sphagni]|uniref:hypothetical protein n=1 Tax=Mycolicibacterium sphagni TaxID=1786 RepID=UPI0021F38CF1|nr:hypothetical protein [Mycolicibacterium sphagni]MCV7177169.1 hypothetical protein [Mycolicibacterium sphagni]
MVVTAVVAEVTCTSATAVAGLADEAAESAAVAGTLAVRLAAPVLESRRVGTVFGADADADAEPVTDVAVSVPEPRAEEAVVDGFVDGFDGPAVDESDFDVLLVLPLEPVVSADATAGVEAIARPRPSATADAPAQQIRFE